MTTRDYQHAARTFRDIREHFYRTRAGSGDRLSAEEALFLGGREMSRKAYSVGISSRDAALALKELNGALRKLGARLEMPTERAHR